jgi:serine/threonine protein kinase
VSSNPNPPHDGPDSPPRTRREQTAPSGARREGGDGSGTRYEAQPSSGGTRREGPGDRATRREGDEPGPVRVNLPPEIADHYEIIKELPVGGEADVLHCRRLKGDSVPAEVVVKVYRSKIRPDRSALEEIRQLPAAHVVPIFDCGDSQFGWWEEQEYMRFGSLADLLSNEGPRLSAERLEEVIAELADALEAVHPIQHRDIKPANIFVRSLKPLDLVLGDFGLARAPEHSIHHTMRFEGSAFYYAPEQLAQDSSIASDWWALGMIVAEAASGRHPFFEPELGGWPSEDSYRSSLTIRPVPLDHIDDPRLLLLCRGLLGRDPAKRWGLKEVRAWQSGQSPAVVEERVAAPARKQPGIPPFVFASERCLTPEELVPVLAQHWEDGLRLMGGAASQSPDYVRLAVWLEDHDHQAALRVLERGAQDRSVARRLFRLLRVLGPDLPPSFRGRVIDRGGLLDLARRATNGDGDASVVLYDLQELGIVTELSREDAYAELLELDENWRSQMELLLKLKGELGPIGKPLDDGDVLGVARARILLCLLDDTALQEFAASLEGAEKKPELAENDQMRELFLRIRDGRT